MSHLTRGSVAVVGVAESDLGQMAPHTTPVDLMAQATMRALDDCGLALSDVDGVFVAATQVRMGPMAFAEYLRIKPRYFDGTVIGGSSFMTHVADPDTWFQAKYTDTAKYGRNVVSAAPSNTWNRVVNRGGVMPFQMPGSTAVRTNPTAPRCWLGCSRFHRRASAAATTPP